MISGTKFSTTYYCNFQQTLRHGSYNKALTCKRPTTFSPPPGINSYVFFGNYQLGVDRIKIEVPLKDYDEDQTLRVTCFIVCKGTMLGWYKDGQLLANTSDPRVNITFAAESDRTSTYLVVERLLVNDSGNYICKAIDCFTGKPVNTSKEITINSE